MTEELVLLIRGTHSPEDDIRRQAEAALAQLEQGLNFSLTCNF